MEFPRNQILPHGKTGELWSLWAVINNQAMREGHVDIGHQSLCHWAWSILPTWIPSLRRGFFLKKYLCHGSFLTSSISRWRWTCTRSFVQWNLARQSFHFGASALEHLTNHIFHRLGSLSIEWKQHPDLPHKLIGGQTSPPKVKYIGVGKWSMKPRQLLAPIQCNKSELFPFDQSAKSR